MLDANCSATGEWLTLPVVCQHGLFIEQQECGDKITPYPNTSLLNIFIAKTNLFFYLTMIKITNPQQ
jgi:hypothetical protein